MTGQRGVVAIDVVASQPAAHHHRPVEPVLIERVAQLQEQMQPLRVQTFDLLQRALLPKLTQRLPELGLREFRDELGQVPT